MNSLESGSNVQSGLEMIMEKSPDTIVLVDRNLTLVKVISAKDDYYHYLANNCIGKQPQALFPDGKNYDQYEIYRAAVKRVFEEQVKVDFSFEVSFEGKNYYYLSQASLFNEELVIVYTCDVSSLKTEKNLQELINTILDRLPLGVFVKDGDNHFNYLYWNHFMEEITGIETREIEGHDDFEVNYNALMTAEERLETDMNVIKTGLTARFKGKVKSASGDYRDIEVAKYPISLNNGKPLVLALWRDITSELATENTLRRTRILTKMALRISDIRPDFIYMMEQAVKAPSGHNTQPWLFRVQKDRIQILPDMSKSLPVVDPDNRELFISLGCATENLCIAAEAKGYAPLPVFSGSGEITVLLSEASMIKETSGLIEEISVRQTNRGIYSGEMIPSDQLSYLRNTPLEENISLHLWSKGEWEFDTLSSYIFAGNNRQMNDHLFKRELKSWMRFNENHVRATSDGLSYAVFGAPNLPRLISETIMGSVLKAGIQNRGDKKKLDSSSHLALFALRTNTLPEWFALGRSLQRFLLRATEKNIAFAFLNQPCEVRDLSGLLAKDLSFTNEIPALILRLGYAKRKMPYSPRKSWRERLVP